jgi:hypothetical protein
VGTIKSHEADGICVALETNLQEVYENPKMKIFSDAKIQGSL